MKQRWKEMEQNKNRRLPLSLSLYGLIAKIS